MSLKCCSDPLFLTSNISLIIPKAISFGSSDEMLIPIGA